MSDYNAPSHTFVRREVDALRALGTSVSAFEIRASGNSEREVKSVLGRPFWAYAFALVSAFFSKPKNFFTTWSLALRHRAPGLRALIWAQFHFVEAIMLAALLSRAGASRLHVHFANSGATVGMLAANYLGLPWSLTLHGTSDLNYPSGFSLSEKVSHANFVACASYFMQAQAMRLVPPEQWHKFRIVRCGVDCRRLNSIRPTSNGSTFPRLICVGRFAPEKWHLGLLEAMQRLRNNGTNFNLTLVGDGPSRNSIEDCVDQLDLRDRVFFAGFLKEDDTLAAIADSDILVLPSLMEGLPVVLIEALALGKPVVASRVAGVPELVEHGKSGVLFTPSKSDELEKVLEEILSSKNTWSTMGETGRARVQSEFDMGRIAKGLQKIFTES